MIQVMIVELCLGYIKLWLQADLGSKKPDGEATVNLTVDFTKQWHAE